MVDVHDTLVGLTAVISVLQYGVCTISPPVTDNRPLQLVVTSLCPHSTRSGTVSQPAGRSSDGSSLCTTTPLRTTSIRASSP